MKKMIAVTGCFVIFCLVINGILIPSLPSVNAENTPPTTQTSYIEESSEALSKSEEFYILKEYNGKIDVYSSNSDKPWKCSTQFASSISEKLSMLRSFW